MKPGSVWVEGTELHFLDGSGAEWFYEGVSEGSPDSGASLGSIWVEDTDDRVYYIAEGSSGAQKRSIPQHVSDSVTDAKTGSVWIDNSEIKYIDTNGDRVGAGKHSHNDSDHDDSGHDDHSDYGHDDHSDADSGHDDHYDSYANHDDTGHGSGFHVDTGHSDTGHDDHSDYDSGHDNHYDSGHEHDDHFDTPHEVTE